MKNTLLLLLLVVFRPLEDVLQDPDRQGNQRDDEDFHDIARVRSQESGVSLIPDS